MEENECLICYAFNEKMICDDCCKYYKKRFIQERIKYVNNKYNKTFSNTCDECLDKYKFEYPKHLETFIILLDIIFIHIRPTITNKIWEFSNFIIYL